MSWPHPKDRRERVWQKRGARVRRPMAEPREIYLTDSQVQQLSVFYEEHGREYGEEQRRGVLLRPAPDLGEGYFEMVILDEHYQPTSHKRVLFLNG